MVNSSNYGLGSSVFSASQNRALALGNRIRAGMTTINDFGVNYLVQARQPHVFVNGMYACNLWTCACVMRVRAYADSPALLSCRPSPSAG